MIRRFALIGFILSILIGFGMFHTKHQVLELEKKLSDIHHEIFKTEESIQILKAEWAHLNDPKRLQHLAKKYLSLKPTDTIRFLSVDQLTSEQRTSKTSSALSGGTP